MGGRGDGRPVVDDEDTEAEEDHDFLSEYIEYVWNPSTEKYLEETTEKINVEGGKCMAKLDELCKPLGFWNPAPYLSSMSFRKDSGRAGGSFEELDGVRALALMWVCAFHIFSCDVLGTWKDFVGEMPSFILAVMEQGQCGVTMFFVLSGFLISHIFQSIRKKEDRSLLGCWALFMYRRFFRIWPALMVSVILVTMAASLWAGTGVFSACGTGEFWSVIWRNGLFMWNLKAWGEEPGCPLSPEVTWSVSTEFQLYIFTPLFVEAYIRNKRLGWLVVVAVIWLSLFCRYYMIETDHLYNEKTAFTTHGYTTDMYYDQNLLYFSSYTRANEYMVGIAAHYVWGELKQFRESNAEEGRFVKTWQTYLFSALVSWPAQLVVYGYWFYTQAWVMWFDYFWNGSYTKAMQTSYLMYNWFLMSGLVGYVIVSTVAMPKSKVTFINKAMADFLASSVLYPIAAVSYTAYLLQYIAWWQFHMPTVTNFMPAFAGYETILFIYACFIGLLLSLVIERPFMKVGRHLEQRICGKHLKAKPAFPKAWTMFGAKAKKAAPPAIPGGGASHKRFFGVSQV